MKLTRDARINEVEMVLSVHSIQFSRVTDNFRLPKAPCCGHHSPSNPPFSINQSNGMWTCFFGRCSKKRGNWATFCDLIGHDLGDDRFESPRFEDYRPEWQGHFDSIQRSAVSSGKYPEILDYCTLRGISKETLDVFRVSNKWGKGIQVPIFCWNENRWTRVNARNIMFLESDPSRPKNFFEVKGGPTHLLMGNNTLDITVEEKRVIITEGQWDMMAGYEIGLRNIFSLPNGASNVKMAGLLQYVPEDWKVYVCVDMDESGNECAEKIFSQIGPERFVRLELPYKDLNEWLIQDPSLTAEMVLETATEPKIDRDEVFDFGLLDFMTDSEEEQEIVIDTPWIELSAYLHGGFRLGEITCLLAPSGVGKTTLVNQISLHVAAKGFKVALISFEGTKGQLKSRVKAAALASEEYQTTSRENLWLTQIHGKKTTFDQLIEAVKKFIRRGADFVVVDNLNALRGDVSAQDIAAQLSAFRTLVDMAVDHGIHLLMVTQPSQLRKGEVVTSAKQKGFSSVYQDTSNHINVNHDYVNDDDSVRILHVEKCRAGSPGTKAFTSLYYRPEYQDYQELEGEKAEVNKGFLLKKR